MFYPIFLARPSVLLTNPGHQRMIAPTPVITTNEFACISHLHNRRFGEGWWGEGYSTESYRALGGGSTEAITRTKPTWGRLFFRLYGWRGHLRGLHTWVAVWPARHACAAALPFSFATIF
jgi:hypothetical protein